MTEQVKKEIACCKVMGLDHEHLVKMGGGLIPFTKDDFVKKMKVWMVGKPLGKLKFFAERLLFEVRERLNDTYMNTTIEAFIFCTPNDFIDAFYQAFCEDGK